MKGALALIYQDRKIFKIIDDFEKPGLVQTGQESLDDLYQMLEAQAPLGAD